MEKQREWRVAVFPTTVSGVGCHFIEIIFIIAFLSNCHGKTVVGFGISVPLVVVSIAIGKGFFRDYY